MIRAESICGLIKIDGFHLPFHTIFGTAIISLTSWNIGHIQVDELLQDLGSIVLKNIIDTILFGESFKTKQIIPESLDFLNGMNVVCVTKRLFSFSPILVSAFM